MYTAVEVNASLPLNYSIEVSMQHINGSFFDFKYTQLDLNNTEHPYGEGCGFLFPIQYRNDTKNETTDHIVFYSRDGNATLSLE